MAKFEKVSRFADVDILTPRRKTASSAGYDFVAAETIVVPSMMNHIVSMEEEFHANPAVNLEQMAKITKKLNAKPTLVSTGMKCQLDPGTYLELSVRSSTPLKYWLILANGVGSYVRMCGNFFCDIARKFFTVYCKCRAC